MNKTFGPFILDRALAVYCLNAAKAYRLRGEVGKAKSTLQGIRAARLRGVVEPYAM